LLLVARKLRRKLAEHLLWYVYREKGRHT
jgi:hypothetical protein